MRKQLRKKLIDQQYLTLYLVSQVRINSSLVTNRVYSFLKLNFLVKGDESERKLDGRYEDINHYDDT